MKLTIDEALLRGVTAYEEGKFQEAERLYRAILQSQPAHPDANHNLGLLAISKDKTNAALPLFKTAIKANPKNEKFWFSYIDALIKEQKLNAAKKIIEQVKKKGMAADKLIVFEKQLSSPNQVRESQSAPQKSSAQLQRHQDGLLPAIELREAGKYREAQEWLGMVIENNSNNAEALSLLSQVLLADKKVAEAERALKAAASISSELPSVYRNQARLLLNQSKPEEALEKAQLGCEINAPQDSESLLVLAACLGANHRDSEALSIIERILKNESNYAEAYANRAFIKMRAKNMFGAIEDAEKSVSLKPHLTQMWLVLHSLYTKCNNLSGAIESLRRAHKNEPENPSTMISLGELLRQDSKTSEAITILKLATNLAPKNANAWTNLGVALQQEKKITDAKIAYKKSLALNPKSASTLSNLGAIAKDAEEWELALQYFNKALELEPNLPEAHSNLGTTFQELGKFDQAEKCYTKAIAFKPDSALTHYNLGGTLRKLGRLEEAEASYIKAITLKPGYASAHNNLGVILKQLGRLDDAEKSYKKSIVLKPNGAEAHYNLGVTLQELGKLDEAEKSYTQAIALDPENSRAHNELLMCLYLQDKKSAFFDQLDFSINHDRANAVIGSLTCRSALKYGLEKPNLFCRKPLEYVSHTDLNTGHDFEEIFVKKAKSILDENRISSRRQSLLVNGYQTHGNLFDIQNDSTNEIQKAIRFEIEKYRNKFKNSEEGLIKKWPTEYSLYGWLISMKSGGEIQPHIHSQGWLSGSIYINNPPKTMSNAGNLVVSLGEEQDATDTHINLKNIIDVVTGSLVLFPASLTHYTIPFESEEERIVLAFDVKP